MKGFVVRNMRERHGGRFLVLAGSLLAGSQGQAAAPAARAGDLTVLAFAAADVPAPIASGPGGEVYRLAFIQGAPQKNKPVANQDGTGSALAVVATKQDVPAAAADVAGRYSILRDGDKDTGCMLTLDNKAKATGGRKASLAPGCRDEGIVIFDPVGWQLVNGHLVLTARKGHKTHLDPQPDGTWKKDPKEGKSLVLKKL